MMILTIDPGDNTGLSFWNEQGEIVSTDFFCLKAKQKSLSTPDKIRLLCTMFKAAIEDKHIDCVIIEGVSLWGQSTKSQTAALRGDTFRLAYLVGAYINVLHEYSTMVDVMLVDVREWKGSLPTDVLIREVTNFVGYAPKNEHVACAIGIGMHHLGKL